MIDVDHFKSINDDFGHQVGDEMIVHLANLARNCKRQCDVLARIGGEEFALLLPETDLQQAQVAAERLCREVAANSLMVASRSNCQHWRGHFVSSDERHFRPDESSRSSPLRCKTRRSQSGDLLHLSRCYAEYRSAVSRHFDRRGESGVNSAHS